MKKILCGTVLLLMLPVLVFGERRTSDSVLEIVRENRINVSSMSVREVVGPMLNSTSNTANSIANEPDTELEPLSIVAESKGYFVVNTENGFVLVSSDDRMPQILGYSDNGQFNPDSIPDSMRDFLAMYDEESESVAQSPSTGFSSASPISFDDEVGPLLATKWGQRAPFYNFAPSSPTTSHCVAGCCATAMAQIMKYYEHPARGKGQHSYSFDYYDYPTESQSLSVSFDVEYNWENMLDYYGNGYTSAQANAVASLLYHCGVSSNMKYGASESSTSLDDVTRALISYFDYDENITVFFKKHYSIEDYCGMIHDELKKMRPVLMRGEKGNNAGHAFVCDGYNKEGYFHINWGWNGSSDGYFLLSALNPNSGEYGDPDGGYNIDVCAFLGIQPASYGYSDFSGPQLFADSISCFTREIVQYAYFRIYAHHVENLKLKTQEKASVQLCCALLDREADTVVAILNDSIGLCDTDGLKYLYYYTKERNIYSIIPYSVEDGVYRLCVCYKDAKSEWKQLNCVSGDDFITVCVDQGMVYFYDNSKWGEKCLINVLYDENKGSVSGSGLWDFGSIITLTATPQKGYRFAGWDDGSNDNQRRVVVHRENTFVANFVPEHYYVKFYDSDSTLIKTVEYVYGTELEVPDVPSDPCHPFKAWNSDFQNILSDTSFHILRDTLRYNVVFYDYDSTTVLKDNPLVECGTSAIPPTDPIRAGYTFERWSEAYDNITEATSVYALYTPNTYSVSFYDSDHTLVGTTNYVYDTELEVPDVPSDPCHPFKAWNSDFQNILSDTSFYILRDTLRYNVVFYDYDSTTVLKDNPLVECGTSAIPPTDPIRAGYTFERWSEAYDNITETTSVYALYTPNTYSVSFYDSDNTLVGTTNYVYGTELEVPDVPSDPCHPFKAWNSDFQNILSDTSFYILRDTLRYNVVFYDYDSTTVLKDNPLVECGTAAVPPTDPIRAGYTFERWSEAYDNITETTSVYALYTPNTYSVSFYDSDNTLVGTTSYVYDTELEVPDVPSDPCHPFKVWNSDFQNILSDTSFYILRDTLRYNVVFYDYDSTTVLKDNPLVECGTAAVPPTDPVREGYTFDRWSEAYDNITETTSVYALYTPNTYSVSFYDSDHTLVGSTSYVYDTELEVPDVPSDPCHPFKAWNSDFQNILSDTSFYILRDTLRYNVVFYDYDSTTVLKDNPLVECGTAAVPPTDPVREGYTFERWSEAYDNIMQATAVYAEYMPNTYEVTFYDFDGSLIGSLDYVYDTELDVPTAPENSCYPFREWNSDFTNILSDTSFLVIRDTLHYTIEFLTYDSTVVKTEEVECGKSATPPTLTEREGYSFAGWSGSYDDVVQNGKVFATYEINNYRLTTSCDKGEVSGAGTYDYGTEVVLEVLPDECCHFVGWSDGNIENPRRITLSSDSAITAICEYDKHTLTIEYDSEKGSVVGGGTYDCGTLVRVVAVPNEGYFFSHWVGSEMRDSFNVTLSDDMTLQAVFDSIVVEPQSYPDSVAVFSTTDTSVVLVWKRNPYVESYKLVYWSGANDSVSWVGANGPADNEQSDYVVGEDWVYLTIPGLLSNTTYDFSWFSCPSVGYYNYPREYMNQVDGQFETLPGSEVVGSGCVENNTYPIYAKDGRVFGPMGMRIFSMVGVDVTTENGRLMCGVYLVRFDGQTRRVVVK